MNNKVNSKKYSPSEIIASVLVFMKEEFNNDPVKIHRTISKLRENEKYREILEDFEFIEYPDFPYSPLLGRTLNRLQESRVLASINPSYDKYQLNKGSKEEIVKQILDKKLFEEKDKLKEIALELSNALQ
jgi:hypothetical protein